MAEKLLRRLLKMTRAAIPNTVRAMVIISTTATTPPMMPEVELEEEEDVVSVVPGSGKHSSVSELQIGWSANY